jgi:ubiquinone/menaquinone biosynthesis C-methylase UbiE
MSIKDRQREHYDRMFREYEDKSRHSAYMNLVRSKYSLDRWAERVSGRHVLDLGCGYGDAALRLVAEHCIVTGLDISKHFVYRARETVGGSDRADWVQGDAERLPFADKVFDAVVSFGTLHHLLHPETAIAEVARVLKPDGWLFAVEPNAIACRSTLEFYGFLIPSGLRERLEKWRVKRQRGHSTSEGRSEAENPGFHVGVRTPAQYADLTLRAEMSASVRTMILPFFPFTLFGLHRYVLTWQIAAWMSSAFATLFPSLRDRGLVQIIEATKGEPCAS